MPDERGYSKCTHCWGKHHESEWRASGMCPIRFRSLVCKMVILVLLAGIFLAAWLCVGCQARAIMRAFYADGPPFHVLHPDRNEDLKCDRYGELLPNVTIDEYLDRAREIDDCKRAHGGMP